MKIIAGLGLDMRLVENAACIDPFIDQVDCRAEMLWLAVREGEIAAEHAAIGRVDTGMIVDEGGIDSLQGRLADHARRDDEDGLRGRGLQGGAASVRIDRGDIDDFRTGTRVRLQLFACDQLGDPVVGAPFGQPDRDPGGLHAGDLEGTKHLAAAAPENR